MTKKRSDKQLLRQRFREDGKYSKVNPCYGCDKSAGVDYASHPLTDCGDWHDIAICLCMKCWNATCDMIEVEEFVAFQNKFKLKK